jgi:hypothetical protein
MPPLRGWPLFCPTDLVKFELRHRPESPAPPLSYPGCAKSFILTWLASRTDSRNSFWVVTGRYNPQLFGGFLPKRRLDS